MLKKEIIILYYGLKDKRTNGLAKLPAVISIIYLLMPFDIIPDFIPFVGYIDDIVVVPLLLNLGIKLLPEQVREESILKASRNKWKFHIAGVFILLLVLGILTGIFFLIRYLITGHS